MSCNDQACSISTLRSTPLPIGVSQEKRRVYESVILYFGDLVMYKIPSKNPNLSMYACAIATLIHENRYIFAICNHDANPLGFTSKLSGLNWVSFQCRISSDDFNLPHTNYVPNSNAFTDTEINQIGEENKIITYQVQGLPLKLQLLPLTYHSGYRARGTVGEALETFATVLFFTS